MKLVIINVTPNVSRYYKPLFLFQVSGSISNTGHSVIFNVDNDTHHHINITGGPLSYKYQFQEIHIHYGLHDQFGSEHSINGYAFPAEVSLSIYASH